MGPKLVRNVKKIQFGHESLVAVFLLDGGNGLHVTQSGCMPQSDDGVSPRLINHPMLLQLFVRCSTESRCQRCKATSLLRTALWGTKCGMPLPTIRTAECGSLAFRNQIAPFWPILTLDFLVALGSNLHDAFLLLFC